ncbi:TniQ family protein [Geotalea sp. SG265]|uniref:TniQ family protein n=1 Tax=Geotalea sp. SG265 TaxID=2922867 RepID=UPI001FB019C2|nr:TniQ family protein [Geotalea sp. SG265]
MCDLYDELDMSLPFIPPRSRLDHLQPVGVGTPYVESQTSYVTRLAAAHHNKVSTLIKSEIGPLLKNKSFAPEKIDGKSYTFSKVVNGIDSTASDWVDVLKRLTLRTDLLFTTLLPYQNILTNNYLLHKSSAWCPACYQEWRDSDLPIYEPLLWKIQAVLVCPVHRYELQDTCPHCWKKQSHLSPLCRPGLCSHCKGWLGGRHEYPIRQNARQSLWYAETVADLLEMAPSLSNFPGQDAVADFIEHLINTCTKGSQGAFCKVVKISREAISAWKRGDYVPQLPAILWITFVMQVPIKVMLENWNLKQNERCQ